MSKTATDARIVAGEKPKETDIAPASNVPPSEEHQLPWHYQEELDLEFPSGSVVYPKSGTENSETEGQEETNERWATAERRQRI